MAQIYSESSNAMELNTKRLKKMNEEINRVSNDLKILNRLTKIESYGVSRDVSSDIALKNSKASQGFELARNRSGINLNFKNLYKADFGNYHEPVEKLPQLQKKLSDNSSLYSKDVSGSPSTKLQAFISNNSRDLKFFSQKGDKNTNIMNSDAYIAKGYNTGYEKPVGLQIYKASESRTEDNVNKTSIYGSNLNNEPLDQYNQNWRMMRDEFSPLESTRILKQKLMNKDAVLTSNILAQQKNQHYLNKSIRNSQITATGRHNSESAYANDEFFKKNYIRDPQTASTGVISSGGLTNKIDPPAKDLNKQSSDMFQRYKSPGAVNRLPSVGKFFPPDNDVNKSTKLPDYTKQRNNESNLNYEIMERRKNVNNFVQFDNQISPRGQKRVTVNEVLRNNWTKLDWSTSATDTIDINKEFRLEKLLGKGNSSVVHRALDLKLNMPVAVKILEKSNIKETYLRDMLQKEIDISSKLEHHNIARLYRVLQDSSKVYLVQEYCGNQTLSQFADNRRISDAKAKNIFKQIASAVNFIHSQGFSHRDLKFSNILISDLGVVKLVDFGFACDAFKRQRIFCGTPSYMPPELIKKKEYIPALVDIWSLGVILFKLVANNYPFGACNDKDLEHKIDCLKLTYPTTIRPEIKDLIDSMLRHSAIERIKSENILKHKWLDS